MKEYLLQYRKVHIGLCNGISSALQRYILTANKLSPFFGKGFYQETSPLAWNRTKLCIKQLSTRKQLQRHNLRCTEIPSDAKDLSIYSLAVIDKAHEAFRQEPIAEERDVRAACRPACAFTIRLSQSEVDLIQLSKLRLWKEVELTEVCRSTKGLVVGIQPNTASDQQPTVVYGSSDGLALRPYILKID